MSGEMIAIIAATIALAGVMVPGMRGIRRDMNRLEVRLTERIARLEGAFEGSTRAPEPRKTRR